MSDNGVNQGSASMCTAEIADGSDSDSNGEESLQHYQPISILDEDNDDGDGVGSDLFDSDEAASDAGPLPNGHVRGAETGISRLDLDSEEDGESDSEEEQELSMRDASDVAMRRAFSEDENRRSAPLAPENAVRVREAMRGVSFPEWTPEWAREIPEDRWIDQLRRLRQPPSSIHS